jgi:protein required for attachment to host cells
MSTPRRPKGEYRSAQHEGTPMNNKVWVVVADEAIARILRRVDGGEGLDTVEEITDPAAHASGAELRRDAQGRRGSTVTASAGPDERHVEAQVFARRVADRLAEGLNQRRFDALHIAAAPRFLGLLRDVLSEPVAATLRGTLDKDLVKENPRGIATRVFAER